MIVVSDNSPLQYLILIDGIDVLPLLYGRVLTTPQVIAELGHPKTPAAVQNWAASPPEWLEVAAPAKLDFIETLDIGEASAISLARERTADMVLIDERAGTTAVRGMGIPAIGTLGILIEAGLEGLIDFEAALVRLTTQTPFYGSKGLIEAARRIFREREKFR